MDLLYATSSFSRITFLRTMSTAVNRTAKKLYQNFTFFIQYQVELNKSPKKGLQLPQKFPQLTSYARYLPNEAQIMKIISF